MSAQQANHGIIPDHTSPQRNVLEPVLVHADVSKRIKTLTLQNKLSKIIENYKKKPYIGPEMAFKWQNRIDLNRSSTNWDIIKKAKRSVVNEWRRESVSDY